MRSAEITTPNRTAGMSLPAWHVVDVRPLPGYRLSVRFADGLSGEVDLRALIERADAGVFEALRDGNLFDSVRVVHGAVSWSDQLDLAPEALHDTLLRNGRCVLT